MAANAVSPAQPHSALRSLLRLALLLAGGVALGFLLLVAAFLLPVDRMEQNVLASVPALDGTWGRGEDSYQQVVRGYETTQLDNSTDAYMLLSAIHRSDAGPVERAINVYTYHHDVYFRQYDTLCQLVKTGFDQMENTPTTRYWLGYLIILKPLLLFFTYLDLRMLNAMLQGLMLLGVALGMQRRGLGRYALPFGLSMICLTPMVTGLSLQFSTALYVMGGAMLLLLWKPAWVQNRLGDAAFFLLTGMATSYFDFLTYPLVTLGMPLVLSVLLREREGAKALLGFLLRCGAAWCAGYLGMWAGKWLLAAVSGNEDFWSSVVGSIQVRTSAASGGESISRLDALKRTLSVFWKKPYLLAAALITGGYAVALVRSRDKRKGGSRALCAPLGLVALLPFVWVLLTANHAYNHAFYVSRTLCVTAFSLLCGAARLCARQPGEAAAPSPQN